MKDMKVLIKQRLLPCFLPVIAVLFFVFLSPAFAEFKKVNECELARANASVTGQPVEPRSYTPCELARANALLTGHPATTLCPEETECEAADTYGAMPAEGDPSANGGGFFSVRDDYGYDWLQMQNMKAVGDLYYEALAAASPSR